MAKLKDASLRGMSLALFLGGLISLTLPGSARAQSREARFGAIQGVVSTQGGTIRLGGASVVVRDASNADIGGLPTEADGQFRIDVAPGTYRVDASFAGFITRSERVVVVAGQTVPLNLDLAIEGISATVDVVAPTAIVSSAETIATSDAIASTETDQFVPGGGVAGALRLLASVIEVPGGVSIKGSRPTQAGMQIGASTIADPSIGSARPNLPDDAIDSVSVLPNPYAVEYGRFSSGLVVIQTRRAGDRWKVRLNNLDPTFRTERQKDWKVTGIAAFGPRLEVGGPIIKDRLFLEQTAQYRYGSDEVPSRPPDELRTTRWLSSFTRVDANLSPRHALTATGGLFPKTTEFASLGTFTPPDATFDVHDRINHAAVTERAIWSEKLVSESTFQIDQYRMEVTPQGPSPMELWPDTTLGNFFNTQRRTPLTIQWIETLSGSHEGPLGRHLFKVGADLLKSYYSGASASQPVLIRRADGTLARRLDFDGPTSQSVRSTDLALYAQDRLQPNSRWFIEYGARFDRDGVLRRWNFTPRVGAAVLLNKSGTSVLRGGFGLFYERTPSAAGAFGQFEAATDARFAGDGVALIGQPIRLAHTTAPDLRTARSATWDLAYDHRLNPQWSLHATMLDRRGTNEIILDPRQQGDSAELLLSSDGRSRYRDVEAGFKFSRGPGLDLNVSYSRSIARSDLNAFANYFDARLWPLIQPNAYGPAPTDAPHRLLARGRVMPTERWLLLGIADWRTGFPYSVVNEALDFVGPRNELRLPNRLRLDLGVERRFRIGKFQPWIGIRAYNALNSFLPVDVQANLGSPSFGSFYNSEYRQLRLQVRFQR